MIYNKTITAKAPLYVIKGENRCSIAKKNGDTTVQYRVTRSFDPPDVSTVLFLDVSTYFYQTVFSGIS